ncbi:MAG TPA: hypothetical protein PKM88_09370 [bacterium]|nr:hypothetical protein [bacterium]
MKNGVFALRVIVLFVAVVGIFGCGAPKNFLVPGEGYMATRQLQMRQYDTKDDTQIVVAVSGVLQDLGFTLAESETELGLISANKSADATSGGQVAAALVLDVLGAVTGSYQNQMGRIDKSQIIKASVIAKPTLDGNRTIVRVTFQRLIWNASDQLSRLESIEDPAVYAKFYEGLSKAIFLEAQQI